MSDEPLGLVRYDAMRRAIAEAYSVDEVKDIRDKALALETYARQAQNDEDERRCREIRMRAERRVGQLLKETERAKGGLPYQATPRGERGVRTLADDGISWDQSSKWQNVASLTDDEFEAALADGASTSDMVEMAKAKERPPETPAMPVSKDALWLWGELDRMEREGWFERDLREFLETMTPSMRDDVCRLAPRAAAWFSRLEDGNG